MRSSGVEYGCDGCDTPICTSCPMLCFFALKRINECVPAIESIEPEPRTGREGKAPGAECAMLMPMPSHVFRLHSLLIHRISFIVSKSIGLVPWSRADDGGGLSFAETGAQDSPQTHALLSLSLVAVSQPYLGGLLLRLQRPCCPSVAPYRNTIRRLFTPLF